MIWWVMEDDRPAESVAYVTRLTIGLGQSRSGPRVETPAQLQEGLKRAKHSHRTSSADRKSPRPGAGRPVAEQNPSSSALSGQGPTSF